MEIFKALMMVFVGLSCINTVLAFFLWKSTNYRPCFYLFLYWISLILDFFLHGKVAHLEPVYRVLAVSPYQFIVHYLIVLVLASMLQIPLRLKKIWFLPIIGITATALIYYFDLPPEFFPIPFIINHSALYFYVAYQAIRYHRPQLTPSLWALAVLYILFGIHLYDFAYFYIRFDYFLIGFDIALVFLIAFSIVVPAAIVERVSIENTVLIAEKKLQERLTQTSKMAALGEMAGGVAHELNNPLAGILLSLESLIDFSDQPENYSEIKPILNNCIGLVDRMSHVVKSLLIFSREDRSGTQQKISLKELLDNTMIFCAEKLKNNNINFSLQLPEKDIQLLIFPAQISQVLLNLVNNAFEAVSEKSEKWIKLQVIWRPNELEFRLTDSGDGIREELRDRIFHPFFTTKPIGKGPGLGLSIAKGIVEAHGGRIFLDTTQSHTCFVFTLPVT